MSTAEKVYSNLFWIAHYLKFRSENLKVLNRLRQHLVESYSLIYPAIRKFKQADRLLTIVQYVMAYLIHAYHFKIFRDEPVTSSTRFVLDCYHIVIFELDKQLVSDITLKKNLDQIFEGRVFFFRSEAAKRLMEIDPHEGSVFHSCFHLDKCNLEKNLDNMMLTKIQADLRDVGVFLSRFE